MKILPSFISLEWYFKENKKHINAVVTALQIDQQLEWITDKQLEWIARRKFVFRYKCNPFTFACCNKLIYFMFSKTVTLCFID